MNSYLAAVHFAMILDSGVSPKGHDGFVVVEAAWGIPDVVVQWLEHERQVEDASERREEKEVQP